MSSQKIDTENHCPDNSSDFRFFKNSSLQGLVSSRLSAKALEGLQELDSLLQKAELNKDSSSTTAGVIELDGQKYFLKRYNNKDFKRKLKNSVRQTRPFKVLKTSQAISAAGIFTPEIFAALNFRRGLLLESSYLLSGFIKSTKTAREIIEDLSGDKNFEIFADKICHVLVKIHDSGIWHGDVKISNIIIHPDENGSYNVGLLDLDGSRCYPETLPDKKRIRDLARVISSYFTSCRDRKLTVKKLNELIDCFARKYCDISGIDLNGDRLTQRTKYLSTRVRKK